MKKLNLKEEIKQEVIKEDRNLSSFIIFKNVLLYV